MNALASLVYLVLLLILTIYIFAVIGFNFFSVRGNSTITRNAMNHDYYSPWTFRDFTHSLLVVFRILCGEWFLPFWECFKSTDKNIVLCSLFFFPAVICINIVLLNLILGVLLDCFDEAKLAEEAEEVLREQTSLDEKASSVKDSEVTIQESQSWSSSILIPYLSLWLEKIRLFLDEDISELTIIITIIISCLFQCLEDKILEDRHGSTIVWLMTKLVYVSTSLIFLLETLIKLLVQGMSFKLSNWWNIAEIFLSTIFVLDMAVFRSRTLQALRVLRAFRLFQPFTAKKRWRSFTFSATVLIRSITAVINVLVVVVYFWFVFSVIGVSLFRGRLYRCTRNRELVKLAEVANKSQCLQKGLVWDNNPINFDDVGKGYLALFQVGTFEGWIEIMQVTNEARGINLQPEKTTSLTSYGYFVVFIIIGVLIVLKLFVGVIVQHCDILRRHADSGVRQLLTSQYMTKYYLAMKRIVRRRPLVLAPRPVHHIENIIYDIVTSSNYEKCIFMLILLYLAFDTFIYFYHNIYKSLSIRIVKMVINYIFLFEVFTELWVYKLLHLHNMANVLDFFCILLCAITSAFANPLDIFVVDPLLLRLCHVIKTDKTLLNVQPAKQLRRLFLTLQISLTSISKIGLLLVLVMYVYSIIGMNLFGINKDMSYVLNFNWIMPSMMFLFHLSTGAGWNTAFEEAIRNSTCSINNNCGQFYSATIYFSTYTIICSFILLNIFVAVVLENFNEIQESKDLGFEEEDLDVLYHLFSKQDPHGTGFIPVLQLSDFLSSLPDPFTINKPNKVTIVVLDIPVYKGIRVHFVDLCSALFTFMLGKTGEKMEQPLKKLLESHFMNIYPERKTMNVIGSTKSLKTYERTLRHPGEPIPSKRDQVHSVAVIQRAWRYYHERGMKNEKEEKKH